MKKLSCEKMLLTISLSVLLCLFIIFLVAIGFYHHFVNSYSYTRSGPSRLSSSQLESMFQEERGHILIITRYLIELDYEDVLVIQRSTSPMLRERRDNGEYIDFAIDNEDVLESIYALNSWLTHVEKIEGEILFRGGMALGAQGFVYFIDGYENRTSFLNTTLHPVPNEEDSWYYW